MNRFFDICCGEGEEKIKYGAYLGIDTTVRTVFLVGYFRPSRYDDSSHLAFPLLFSFFSGQ